MSFEKFRINSVNQKSIWMTDKNGFQAEYIIPKDVDCSDLISGTEAHFEIKDGKITERKKPETITGYVGLIVEKSVKIDERFFLRNGMEIPEEIRAGVFVEAMVNGETLISIIKAHAPEKPPEMKKGSGKITALVQEPPHLEYEYSWTPQGEEKKTNISKFDLFSDEALEQIKGFRVGDWVTVQYSKKNGKLTLECIEKKVWNNKNGLSLDPKTTRESFLSGPAMQYLLYCKDHSISGKDMEAGWVEYLNLIKSGEKELAGVGV
jgi:hypothetical protein